jgi:hypothetical protein
VEELQRILLKAGLYDEPVDGRFGLITEEAVADLERALGLSVDGMAGRDLIRFCSRPPFDGGWIVHRILTGESPKSIAKQYGIGSSVMVSGRKRMLVAGKTLFIPQKNLWVRAEEYRDGLLCTGCLVNNGTLDGKGEPKTMPVWRVYTVEEILSEQGSGKNDYPATLILDGRKKSLPKIGQAIHRITRLKSVVSVWVWMEDHILEVPGAISYLGIDRNRVCGRMIIELNPPLFDQRRRLKTGHGWIKEWRREPLIYSINLMPRLDLGGERTVISPKEARLWRYRSTDNKACHIGRFQWAMLPVENEVGEGRLWFVDSQTMKTLYRAVIQEYRSGIILEGLHGVDSRMIQMWQDYFALGRNGHEMTLRDIYLKRERL